MLAFLCLAALLFSIAPLFVDFMLYGIRAAAFLALAALALAWMETHDVCILGVGGCNAMVVVSR